MSKFSIAFGLALAADVLGGVSGLVRADIAVAVYIGMVALAATMLVLTSRPALAPVGYVPRPRNADRDQGILVRAVAGAPRQPVSA